MRVAITGNIGSGKSYVSDLFKSLGVPVFDSDREAKLLYDLPEVRQRMVERFGDNIYSEDGTLDRKLMASKVFADACALGYVESVLYPVLNKRFTDWADQQGTLYVLYESALIFEKHLEEMFDAIIVVAASESVRIRRVMTRDRCTEEQVRARMAMQLPQTEKVTKADFVIVHEADDEDEALMKQVWQIHSELIIRL
jgi:dephospho-CoA kinase